jgi:hypothetical protein
MFFPTQQIPTLQNSNFCDTIRPQEPVAQLDRALVCGTRGHRFNSCRAHQAIARFTLRSRGKVTSLP